MIRAKIIGDLLFNRHLFFHQSIEIVLDTYFTVAARHGQWTVVIVKFVIYFYNIRRVLYFNVFFEQLYFIAQ
jgi:hypothetical protein